MKHGITLSPRELLFIAALLDAREFMGVPDAFFGMEESEMQQEMMALQSSLEERGYAEMDFDGSFTLSEDVMGIVDICANCDTFIVVDKNKSKQEPLRELYYAKAGRLVKLSEGSDGNALTFVAGMDELLEHISQDMEWMASSTGLLKNVKVANAVLAEAKEKATSSNHLSGTNILIENGCDQISAEMIVSGLVGASDYFAVIITVFEGEREGVHNIMLTSNENGIYRLVPIMGEEQDAVQFIAHTDTEADIALADVVRGAFPTEREWLR